MLMHQVSAITLADTFWAELFSRFQRPFCTVIYVDSFGNKSLDNETNIFFNIFKALFEVIDFLFSWDKTVKFKLNAGFGIYIYELNILILLIFFRDDIILTTPSQYKWHLKFIWLIRKINDCFIKSKSTRSRFNVWL